MNTKQEIETCTIAVMPRDRFSTTEQCIEILYKNTPEPFELMVLLGGAPEDLKKRLQEKYGSRATLVFEPEFLNGCELRNKALELAKTRLIVFVDSEVFVQPGWLAPLIECQKETDASMVSPIIIDRKNLIHTAGNDFFITEENGKKIGTMELRYANHFIGDTSNIPRRQTDFGEIHCQLAVVETARKVKAFDNRLREHQEMDAGLVLKEAGCIQMCEPRSRVYLHYPELIDEVQDIGIFQWKWEIDAMQKSIDLFYEKWNIDINHNNNFIEYFKKVNRRVGTFSRFYPSRIAIAVDFFLLGIQKQIYNLLKKMINLIPSHP